MAFAAQYTLADARAEVLTRLGFAEQGTANTRATKSVNSFIQQAVNMLALEVEWTPQMHELRIPLTEGQDTYEFPDETEVGNIEIQLQHENGKRLAMIGGINQQDWLITPSDTTLQTMIGQPLKWRLMNGSIQILPAPTTVFTHLVVTYQDRRLILREDGDLLPFDSEAIIQFATVLGKIKYQQPGIEDAKQIFRQYLSRVLAKQGEGKVFNAGGRQSHYLTRDKRVPLGTGIPNIGPYVPYTDGWNPW